MCTVPVRIFRLSTFQMSNAVAEFSYKKNNLYLSHLSESALVDTAGFTEEDFCSVKELDGI